MEYRGVAQMVAHVVWDHGVAGSNPVAPTINCRKSNLKYGHKKDMEALPCLLLWAECQ